MTKEIVQKRFEFYEDTTIGKLLIDGKHFCYTLEDAVRPSCVKIYGKTAIPPAVFKVGIRFSKKFNREVVVIYTEDDGFTIDEGGVQFTYVYAHGGNTAEDTDGCVLVAYNHYGDKIQGTAEKDLFNVVKRWIYEGYDVLWKVEMCQR